MMQQLWTALQGKPATSTAEESRGQQSGGFAILPKSSDHDFALAEVQSKLDQALSFLQRDVGYCLLADARPDLGGGIRLSRVPTYAPQPIDRMAKKSNRFPPLDPSTGNVTNGGHSSSSSSAPSLAHHTGLAEEEILIKDPDTAKYAHFQEDLLLVSRFVRVISEGRGEHKKKMKHEALYKTVLQGVRLMHLCEYHYADVVLVLAYASVYFRSTFDKIGHKMSEHEAAHVCVLLIYLAHSFLLDETCPLRCWQKHIFRKYCTLKVLDAALYRLFQMRKEYKLRVTDEELKEALQRMGGLVNGFSDRAGVGSSSSSQRALHSFDDRDQWWNPRV